MRILIEIPTFSYSTASSLTDLTYHTQEFHCLIEGDHLSGDGESYPLSGTSINNRMDV